MTNFSHLTIEELKFLQRQYKRKKEYGEVILSLFDSLIQMKEQLDQSAECVDRLLEKLDSSHC